MHAHAFECLFWYFQIDQEITVDTDELMSHSDLVSLFTKARNRPHFAALIVEQLFDEETRAISNVRGRKKEKLDERKIEYVPVVNSSCLYCIDLGG